jgi:hypothetical protein
MSPAEALEWQQHEQMLKDMERQEDQVEEKQREEFEERLKVDEHEADEDLADVTQRLAVASKDDLQSAQSHDLEQEKPQSGEEPRLQSAELEKPQLT